MKIGELKQRCGECVITEFCGNPYGFCICNKDIFRDVDEKSYREIADKAETILYPECVGCDDDECEGCDCEDDSRDYFCEQIADNVKKVIKLN